MYFTQEDYRKIEKWLLANSKKDTQFVEAATPLQGNETITFVQNGKNVKTSVKDIVDQLFLLGVSDFLNITDKSLLTKLFNLFLSGVGRLVRSLLSWMRMVIGEYTNLKVIFINGI